MRFSYLYFLSSLAISLITGSAIDQKVNPEIDSKFCMMEADSDYDLLDSYFSGRLSDNTLARIWSESYEHCMKEKSDK